MTRRLTGVDPTPHDALEHSASYEVEMRLAEAIDRARQHESETDATAEVWATTLGKEGIAAVYVEVALVALAMERGEEKTKKLLSRDYDRWVNAEYTYRLASPAAMSLAQKLKQQIESNPLFDTDQHSRGVRVSDYYNYLQSSFPQDFFPEDLLTSKESELVRAERGLGTLHQAVVFGLGEDHHFPAYRPSAVVYALRSSGAIKPTVSKALEAIRPEGSDNQEELIDDILDIVDKASRRIAEAEAGEESSLKVFGRRVLRQIGRG